MLKDDVYAHQLAEAPEMAKKKRKKRPRIISDDVAFAKLVSKGWNFMEHEKGCFFYHPEESRVIRASSKYRGMYESEAAFETRSSSLTRSSSSSGKSMERIESALQKQFDHFAATLFSLQEKNTVALTNAMKGVMERLKKNEESIHTLSCKVDASGHVGGHVGSFPDSFSSISSGSHSGTSSGSMETSLVITAS